MMNKKLNKKIIKKVSRGMAVLALAGAVLAGGSTAQVQASVVTAGSWTMYYNSPGSYKTSDYVLLTVDTGAVYTAKCSTLTNSNLAVDFTNNSIAPAGDGSLVFKSTGSKRFKFSGVANGKNYNVSFDLVRLGNATGTAKGTAKLN